MMAIWLTTDDGTTTNNDIGGSAQLKRESCESDDELVYAQGFRSWGVRSSREEAAIK